MALNTGNTQKPLRPRRNTQLAMMTVIRETRTRKPHMVEYDDDDEEREGPVVVRRAAYDAGMKLEAGRKTADPPAFEIAREQAAQFRAAGKPDEAAFWDEVFQFLMTRESVGAETETIILEHGETYDWDEGKVIRS